MGFKKIRFPETSASASSPSRRRHRALVRKAIQYAIDTGAKSLTFVQRGQHQKFTEGGSPVGLGLAQKEFRRPSCSTGPWMKIKAAHGDM